MKSKFNKISIHLLVFLVLISLQFPISAVHFYHPSGKILDDRTEPTCKDHPNVTTVKNIRNDGIKFSWEQPPCWNNHKVRLDAVLTPIPSNCTAPTYNETSYVESNFFVIRNLLPNTKYRYSMKLNKQAIPTGNKSIWINPEPPKNIQTKNIMTNGFKISWIKPKSWFCNNFRFEIVLSVRSINYFNSTFECEIELNETKSYNIDSTQGEHEIKGLLPYVEYKYWFKLNNAWNSTNTANLVRTKPSAPEQVQYVFYNIEQNKVIRISYKPPCRINGNFREFILNVTENTNQSKFINHIYRTNDNFYDLENITSSTNYIISIQAVLDSNMKGQVKNIIINSGHIASDPPQNISLSEIGSNSFSLSWNKPRKCFGNIKNYNIHLVSLINCHKKFYVDNTNVSADDFYTNFDNLLPNSLYSVKIKAITESGDGDWSRYFDFQTLPGQPKNVTYKINSESVNISWKSPCSLNGNINGFLLNITQNENNLITVIIDYINETIDYSYEFQNITFSAAYDVSIQAVLKNNIVGETAHINFTTKHIASNPPENFAITKTGINYLEILWNKPQKSFGNIVEYEISLEGPEKEVYHILKNISCNQLEYKFFNLTSNTSYAIKIKANTETGDGKWSRLIVSKTKELGLVSKIQIKNVQSNSFSVIWNKTDADNVKYNISLNKLKPNYSYSTNCKLDRNIENFISEGNSYKFTGLQPFYNYSVTIAAILLLEEGQFSEPIFVTTLESIPMKPRNLNHLKKDNSHKKRYNVSEIIKWSAPCRKNGTIKGYHLSIKGSFTEDNSIKYLKSIVVDSVESKENYSYTIKNVNSSFNYEVFIQTSLSKEIMSDKANMTFTTSEWYPEAPESVKIADQSESHIFVTWKKPAFTNGKIISYAINFTSYGQILTNFKEHCSYKDEINWKIQNTEELLFNFTDLLPHSNYSVVIKANTSVGYGKYSTEIYGLTKDAAPEQPQNFTLTNIRIKQQIGSVDLKWTAPCHQNGHIKEFSIKVKGIYSVNDIEIYSMSKNVNFSNDTFLYALSISDLIPSCNYTAQIFAILENGLEGKISEKKTFSLLSGIPEPPSNVELNVTKNILMLSWKNSPTPVGEIVKYQIYIIPPHNYCNMQEASDVELLTDPNQTYTVSIAASTGENRTGLPINETLNAIYGSSSNDYDASLTLEGIAFCKQSKAIKQFDIIIEKNCSKTDVKVPENSNELVKSHFQLFRQYGTVTTNYTVRIRIQFESDKGKIQNDLTLEAKMTSQSNESSNKFSVAIAIVVSVFGFIIIISLILFVLWKKKILNFSFNNNSSAQEIIQNDERNILLNNIDSILHDSNKITAQFEQLEKESKKFKCTTEYALLPGNRKKNRYRNILPFDSTRVQLKIEKNDEERSDYINASFIKGFSGNVEYIATQGPLPTTCKDFWKMILQENVTIIVMLTQVEEKEKVKCFKYFPNNQETLELSDDFKVRCAFEINFESYCVKNIQIQTGSDLETVYHIQFLNWPDLGVPSNIPIILEFLQDIRQRFKANGGLIAVHCSAGVGRTGTLIALDILLQAIEWKKPIDIYQTVLELRMQRCFMVQTTVQFQFIHSCINEALKNNNKPEIKEDLSSLYENIKPMSEVKKNVEIIYENAESVRFLQTDETNF